MSESAVLINIHEFHSVTGLTATQYQIFNFLLLNMNNKNISAFGSFSKSEFMDERGMANQTFNNNIGALVKAGLVCRHSPREYLINKRYAVRAPWSDVQKIRVISEYSPSGKVETIEVERGTA